MMMVFGEIGLSARTEIRFAEGENAEVGDLLDDSLWSFLETEELEFTAMALALWLPPSREWVTKGGRKYSFDDLASLLLSKPLAKGACNGVHQIQALVYLDRINEQMSILDRDVARMVRRRIKEVASLLEIHQADDGSWHGEWNHSDAAPEDVDSTIDGISATGHHLEWIALAPAELTPDRERVGKAARFLVRSIKPLSPATVANSYAPLSHAVRALCLLENLQDLRGVEDAQEPIDHQAHPRN